MVETYGKLIRQLQGLTVATSGVPFASGGGRHLFVSLHLFSAGTARVGGAGTMLGPCWDAETSLAIGNHGVVAGPRLSMHAATSC